MHRTSVTLIALLVVLTQFWAGFLHGRVLCVTVEPVAPQSCSQAHDHDHPCVMQPTEQSDPCDHCIHIQVPDDLQTLPGPTAVKAQQAPPLLVAYPLVLAWALPQDDFQPVAVGWSTPPPLEVPRGQARAISCTKLLI